MPVLFDPYVPGNSVIHRLDPRIKLYIVVLAFFVSVVFNSPWYLGSVFVGTLILALIARVPWPRLKLLLSGLGALVAFSFILWPLFVHEGRILISFWRITITDKGLYYAAAIAFRIINLIFVSMLLLMILTRQDDLVNGLRLLGVPYKVSFTLGTALRFVPTVVGEALMVIDAQKARGLELEKGSLISRAKKYFPILIPLVVRSIMIAQQLSLALEARGFARPGKRTIYKRPRFTREDYIAAAIAAGLTLLAIYLRITGHGLVLGGGAL